MLDNSHIHEPLPGDLQARIENAQNQVTQLEAEESRLSRLINSKKGEYNSLHTEFKSKESLFSDLKKAFDHVNADFTKKTDELNRLNYAIKDANHELEEAKRQKIETVNEIAQKTKDLEIQIAQANANDEAIHARHLTLSEKEKAHEEKVNRLLEALK